MKVQDADPMIKEAFSQYHKEIAHESEKAHLLERIKQESIQIVIDPQDADA